VATNGPMSTNYYTSW